MTITVTEWNNPDKFASRHVAVGPLAYNRLLIVATGVIVIDFRGTTPDSWRKDVLRVGLNPNVISEASAQGWLPSPSPGHVWSYDVVTPRDVTVLVTGRRPPPGPRCHRDASGQTGRSRFARDRSGRAHRAKVHRCAAAR